jgi:hypothetical protein
MNIRYQQIEGRSIGFYALVAGLGVLILTQICKCISKRLRRKFSKKNPNIFKRNLPYFICFILLEENELCVSMSALNPVCKSNGCLHQN